MADFDAIIVGGGFSGITAAYVMANAGLEVLLIERGNYCGSKNMTGGRLYGHSLETIIPDFANQAPIERLITKERYSVRKDGVMSTVEYNSADLESPKGKSYSILRGKFDQWYAYQAENAGAALVCGVRVDDLIMRDGVVCGVIAGEELMTSDVVILADGVNSLLGQKLSYKKELSAAQTTVGVKELIELDPVVIDARFGLKSGEGLAWMFRGCYTEDGICDGFLYTNKDSISLGITMTVANIDHTEISVPQMLENFKNSADIYPMVKDGRLTEYSAHLIPEGGYQMIPKLYGNGILICGDAAGFTANLGLTLRGMDLAVESGKLAAEAVIAAKAANNYAASNLSSYQAALENSFVFACIKGCKACKEALENKVFSTDPAIDFNQAMINASILL